MSPERAGRNIRLLMLFNFFEDFIPYSVFTILIFAEIAGSFTAATAAISIVMLMQVLSEVPTGLISDMVGRKRTMIFGGIASSLSVVCYIFAQDAALIFIGAALGGITRAFYSGNNDAMLYDTLVEAGREHDYRDVSGRTSSMFQVAGAASAITGGILAAGLGYRAVLIASLFPQIACIGVALLMTNPKPHLIESRPFGHLRESAALIWRNPRLRFLALGQMTGFAFGEVAFQFRAAFVERLWPLWAIGLMRAMSNVLGAISFFFAGRVIRRVGERRLMLGVPFGTNLIDIVWIVNAGILSPFVMGLNSIFYGVVSISSRTLIQREFSPQHRATMGSVAALGGSFMFAVVSISFGLITDAVGPDAALIFALIGAMGAVFWYRKALNEKPVAAAVARDVTA
jgi:MFS family permease